MKRPFIINANRCSRRKAVAELLTNLFLRSESPEAFELGLKELVMKYGERLTTKTMDKLFLVPVEMPVYSKSDISNLIDLIRDDFEQNGENAVLCYDGYDGLTVHYYAYLVAHKYGYDVSPFQVMLPTDEDVALVAEHVK